VITLLTKVLVVNTSSVRIFYGVDCRRFDRVEARGKIAVAEVLELTQEVVADPLPRPPACPDQGSVARATSQGDLTVQQVETRDVDGHIDIDVIARSNS
jgi:hypothetical protein